MGEVLVQSLLGGILGVMAGYVISYFPGFLSLSIPTPWEMNLIPAFAKILKLHPRSFGCRSAYLPG